MPPHLVIGPIVLPLMLGAALLLLERRGTPWAGRLALVGTALLVLMGIQLVQMAAGSPTPYVYLLGNWQVPFGIALALDRLSALMVLLTSVVAFAALLYARGGDDARGRHFHSLFQFQLMGLNGAFLTADLFNLFVFFEVLLIASYGLLLHGAGAARIKASIHYVAFNLTGSALFLIAVSLLYGLTGTLNMADLAQRIPQLPPDRTLLVQSAALMLLVVFGVKAALLPLFFWLPATYGSACAPVAALFAIMTKVGVYAILRMTTLIFGAEGGPTAAVASPWLELLAMGTLLLGAVGAMSSRRLRTLIGNAVVASAGTLLLAVALARPGTVGAGLFYLVNSTLVAAALFLFADRLRALRGSADDHLVPAPVAGQRLSLGLLFFGLAIAAAGLPPLAGFLGKALLLQSAGVTPWGGAVVAVILSGSLMMMVAFSTSGSRLFWKPADSSLRASDDEALRGLPVGAEAAVAADDELAADRPVNATAHHRAALALLIALLLACSVWAAPLAAYTQATAQQLFQPAGYRQAVLSARPVPAAIDVRREMREREGQGKAQSAPTPGVDGSAGDAAAAARKASAP
ncbi:MAG: monovalent cation/H+ antiporter subunit D [Rubrivivax sp.]|nr:monovalent cation/H+ antiporter subunit D [Rubrivivax sp.]